MRMVSGTIRLNCTCSWMGRLILRQFGSSTLLAISQSTVGPVFSTAGQLGMLRQCEAKCLLLSAADTVHTTQSSC